MTDTNPQAAPVAPAVAAPAAVAPVVLAPQQVVEVDVYGKKTMVPIAELAAGYQTVQAGRQALEDAKAMRQSAHIDSMHAERWRQFEASFARDPQKAMDGLQALVDARANGTPNTTDTPHPSGDGNTSQLQERIARLEETQNQGVVERQVQGVLDRYPTLTGKSEESQGLRASARLVALSAIASGSSPEDAVRSFHDPVYRVAGSALTALRDGRAERAESMPHVPANAGNPELVAPPKATGESLRKGTWAEESTAWWNNVMARAAGPRP